MSLYVEGQQTVCSTNQVMILIEALWSFVKGVGWIVLLTFIVIFGLNAILSKAEAQVPVVRAPTLSDSRDTSAPRTTYDFSDYGISAPSDVDDSFAQLCLDTLKAERADNIHYLDGDAQRKFQQLRTKLEQLEFELQYVLKERTMLRDMLKKSNRLLYEADK